MTSNKDEHETWSTTMLTHNLKMCRRRNAEPRLHRSNLRSKTFNHRSSENEALAHSICKDHKLSPTCQARTSGHPSRCPWRCPLMCPFNTPLVLEWPKIFQLQREGGWRPKGADTGRLGMLSGMARGVIIRGTLWGIFKGT